MRTRTTTVAVLREKIGIKDFEMAKILGRSKYTIHALESGRLKLSHELAKKFFHETGISPSWLLNGDPVALALAANGDEYKREHFERAQAGKIYYDQPHPLLRNDFALGVLARLFAILESAAAKRNYYMAQYKVQTALDLLQKEFGIDGKVYQYAGPHVMNPDTAIAAVKKVLARYEERQGLIEKARASLLNAGKKQKPSSKKHRRKG